MPSHPAVIRSQPLWAALDGLTGWSGRAGAQGTPQQLEISAQPLSETDQRRRDPAARSIVGREQLNKHGDISVSDVLKRQPGVTMQGGSPRLRGLGGAHTPLPVNGEPALPGFPLDQLSPSQLERIEITRGPSAAHSAQAVAGTLNIILREARRTRQRALSARFGWQAVRPVLGGHASWGGRSGALSSTVPVSVDQWRGQADTLSERSAPGADGRPQELRAPGSGSFWGGSFNTGPRLTWTMLRSSLQRNHKAASGLRLALKAGAQRSSSRSSPHTEGDDANGIRTLVRDSDNHNTGRSWTASGQASRPPGEAHTLALGWELARRSRTAQRRTVQDGRDLLVGCEGPPFDATITRSAVFAQVHHRSQVVTPVLHLTRKLQAGGRDLLRASLTRSHKAPEPNQLSNRPRINTLYPVPGTNAEISPGPDNRLAQQQPWWAATGFDQVLDPVLGGPADRGCQPGLDTRLPHTAGGEPGRHLAQAGCPCPVGHRPPDHAAPGRRQLAGRRHPQPQRAAARGRRTADHAEPARQPPCVQPEPGPEVLAEGRA